MPGQYAVVNEKCWEDILLWVLDREIIAEKEAPGYYLGRRQVRPGPKGYQFNVSHVTRVFLEPNGM